MRSCLILILMIVGLIPTAVLAQNSDVSLPALPACDGDYAIVRVSEITSHGDMQGFLKAVEAHKAWYRSHGFKNNEIRVWKIIVQDPKTKAWKYSDNEVMLVHIRPPRAVQRDAAWDAFIKQYGDNSKIKSEYITCMLKDH
jgi:hypothetical protein